MAEETVKTYWAKFGLDASNFLNGITAAQKEFLAFTAGVTASVAVFTLAFNEYSRLVQKYGQMANELEDLSYATGVTNEELQRFHYAATLSGDDIGMVDAMLGKLTLSMGQFADKTSPAAKAFQALSVDPTGKSTTEVFDDIAKAFDHIPDPGTRASIAIDLLGKSYRDSLPYMKDYIENQDKIKSAITFSPSEQQAMKDYKQGLDDLGHSWEVFWGKLFFGKPTPTKEAVESISQMWRNQYHYTDEEIKKSLVSNYGLEALQKIGYYTENTTAATSKIDFADPFKNLDSNDLALEKLNLSLKEYNDQMEAARQKGDKDAFEKAALAARATKIDIEELTKTIRDQKLQYQEIADITLPKLKEALIKAKASGIKSEIEAAQIALDQGVNSANDLAKALGKGAISADSIKAAITPASGWSYDSVVGSAGSNMQTFMLDEMNHGASYAVALQAWASGAHSYANFEGKKYATGTLGDLANANPDLASTRNPGKNEREATAAAAKAGKSAGTATADATGKTATSPADQSKIDTQTLSAELSKQADLFGTLNDKIAEGWLNLEKVGVDHWKALDEEARITYQNIMDNAAAAINFAGSNPVIQKFVVLSKNGYDIDPSPLPKVSAAGLAKAADFSTVKFSAGSASGQGSNIKVDVVVKDQTSGGIKADVKATDKSTRESWASASGAGGTN